MLDLKKKLFPVQTTNNVAYSKYIAPLDPRLQLFRQTLLDHLGGYSARLLNRNGMSSDDDNRSPMSRAFYSIRRLRICLQLLPLTHDMTEFGELVTVPETREANDL